MLCFMNFILHCFPQEVMNQEIEINNDIFNQMAIVCFDWSIFPTIELNSFFQILISCECHWTPPKD